MGMKAQLKRQMIEETKRDPEKRLKFKACGIISIVASIISLAIATFFLIFNPTLMQSLVKDAGMAAIITVFIYILLALIIVAAFIVPAILALTNALIQIGVNRKPISIIAVVLSLITILFGVFTIIMALKSFA